MVKNEGVEHMLGISKGVFEETKNIIYPYEMFLPVPLQFGAELEVKRSFPFYPFFNYEVFWYIYLYVNFKLLLINKLWYFWYGSSSDNLP